MLGIRRQPGAEEKFQKLLRQAVFYVPIDTGMWGSGMAGRKKAPNLPAQGFLSILYLIFISLLLFCHDMIFCHSLCVVRINAVLLHEDVM